MGAATPLRARLREKLPEILIEAGSVVLALLLAFAVNAWHERAQDEERATIAKQAILRELRSNADDLRSSVTALRTIVDSLKETAAAKEAPPSSIHVGLGLSLLSSAAWHATLATQASQLIDFDWMTRMAKVYELQDTFLRMQGSAVDALAAGPGAGHADAHEVAAALLPRMDALSQIASGLATAYDDVLADPAVQVKAK